MSEPVDDRRPEAEEAGPRMLPLADADTTELVGLARTALGEGRVPRTSEFWEWKHRDNPFGPSIGLVARAPDGALAGMRAFMRWRWAAGEQSFSAVRAVDTATHPDWRRKGLFRRLTEAALEQAAEQGVDFVFNTPNDKSLPGYLKMGWRRVGRISVRARPYRPLRALVRAVRARVADTGPPPEPPTKAGEILAASDLESLFGDWRSERRFHTPRGADYLHWRYGSAPSLRYGAVAAGAGDAPAVVVYRLRWRGGLLEAMVCELLLGDGREAIGSAARLLKELGRETGADYAVALGAGDSPEASALGRAGFIPIPGVGPVLTVRPVSDRVDPSMLLDWKRWRPSAGDVELF